MFRNRIYMTAAKLNTCMFICTLHTHLCDLYNCFLQAEYVHFCHKLLFKKRLDKEQENFRLPDC